MNAVLSVLQYTFLPSYIVIWTLVFFHLTLGHTYCPTSWNLTTLSAAVWHSLQEGQTCLTGSFQSARAVWLSGFSLVPLFCVSVNICAKVFVCILDYFLRRVLPGAKCLGILRPEISLAEYLSNRLRWLPLPPAMWGTPPSTPVHLDSRVASVFHGLCRFLPNFLKRW